MNTRTSRRSILFGWSYLQPSHLLNLFVAVHLVDGGGAARATTAASAEQQAPWHLQIFRERGNLHVPAKLKVEIVWTHVFCLFGLLRLHGRSRWCRWINEGVVTCVKCSGTSVKSGR